MTKNFVVLLVEISGTSLQRVKQANPKKQTATQSSGCC
jgi:hypothetical protein